jgi:hypothetical protein
MLSSPISSNSIAFQRQETLRALDYTMVDYIPPPTNCIARRADKLYATTVDNSYPYP